MNPEAAARSAAFDSPAFANAERFVLKGAGPGRPRRMRAVRGAAALAAGTLQARAHPAAARRRRGGRLRRLSLACRRCSRR